MIQKFKNETAQGRRHEQKDRSDNIFTLKDQEVLQTQNKMFKFFKETERNSNYFNYMGRKEGKERGGRVKVLPTIARRYRWYLTLTN